VTRRTYDSAELQKTLEEDLEHWEARSRKLAAALTAAITSGDTTRASALKRQIDRLEPLLASLRRATNGR
jgi:hypothetical protein